MSSERPMMRSILRCAHAAGAGLGDDAGDVAGAVAHERAALARERGEHQFAVFAIRHRLQGLGSTISAKKWSSARCRPLISLHSKATPGP